MKIKRKILFFAALMCLFYCLTLMQDTYAKYISSATSSANLTIARWNILINNQDILQNSNFSDTIQPQFAGTSNIKSLYIYNIGTGINKVPFVVTSDGTVYRLNSEEKLVKYEELSKYKVNKIIKHEGEISDTFTLSLIDGSTKLVEIQYEFE